ncbi:MAG: diguanylate cyclase [Anaerolineae bacterium]
MPEEVKLLIVDDEIDMCETLAYLFRGKGYRTDIATTGCRAAERIENASYDLVVTDIRLPDSNGMELVDLAREVSPDTAIIIITAFASVETAIRALNDGACGYLVKPFDLKELVVTAEKALERQRLIMKNKCLLAELKGKNEELEKLSITNGLTGLYNRQHFEKILAREEARVQRYGTIVTVVMVDINNLKYINDRFGHTRGDMIIRETARLLRDTCRASDVVARYGGDEMVILLSETTEKEASHFASRLRAAERKWNRSNPDPGLTLSLAIGYASTEDETGLMAALNQADANMYRDKARYYRRHESRRAITG